MEIIITYQKNNGEIFFRARTSLPENKIGEYTSMGWKILNIHYKYGNNYYVEEDYRRIKRKDKESLKNRIIRRIIRRLNKFV